MSCETAWSKGKGDYQGYDNDLLAGDIILFRKSEKCHGKSDCGTLKLEGYSNGKRKENKRENY